MATIKIITAQHVPICPYCEKSLEEIAVINHGTWEKHAIYVCPHCNKVLSIAQDRLS